MRFSNIKEAIFADTAVAKALVAFCCQLGLILAYDPSVLSSIFLIIMSFVVLEMVNTSIEQTCNAITTSYNNNIRVAKDMMWLVVALWYVAVGIHLIVNGLIVVCVIIFSIRVMFMCMKKKPHPQQNKINVES